MSVHRSASVMVVVQIQPKTHEAIDQVEAAGVSGGGTAEGRQCSFDAEGNCDLSVGGVNLRFRVDLSRFAEFVGSVAPRLPASSYVFVPSAG